MLAIDCFGLGSCLMLELGLGLQFRVLGFGQLFRVRCLDYKGFNVRVRC